MCWIIIITILIGEDMFKPSYKDPDAGKDWRKEEKGMTGDEMVGWHHWLKGREFEQTPGDGEGQGSLACCSPWGRKELDMTEWLNNSYNDLKPTVWNRIYVYTNLIEYQRINSSEFARVEELKSPDLNHLLYAKQMH